MVWEALQKFQDGSEDPSIGATGRGPSRRSEMGWWTLLEVRNGSGDPPVNPGRAGRSFGRSCTGWLVP